MGKADLLPLDGVTLNIKKFLYLTYMWYLNLEACGACIPDRIGILNLSNKAIEQYFHEVLIYLFRTGWF